MSYVACFLNSFNWKLYPEIRSKWIFMPTALETRRNVVRVLKIRLWSKNKLTGNGGRYRESESPHLRARLLPYLSSMSSLKILPYLESPRFLPRRQKKSSVEPSPNRTVAFPTSRPAWKNPSRTNVSSAFFNLPRPCSGSGVDMRDIRPPL